MGRPSKYSEEMLEKGREYLANFEELGDQVPTMFGLADALGVCRKTLYVWDDPDFQDLMSSMNSKQARILINKGLSNDYNQAIVKLLLYNHGFADKVVSENTVGITVVSMDATDEAL